MQCARANFLVFGLTWQLFNICHVKGLAFLLEVSCLSSTKHIVGTCDSSSRLCSEQTILIVAFGLSLVRGSARTTNIESVMKFAQLAPASRLVGVVSPACIRYNQALNQWCDGCKPQPASALTVTRVSENRESSPMCYMCSATQ